MPFLSQHPDGGVHKPVARRRTLRHGEEYRDLSPAEWDEFLGHFELRKVELGVCTSDFGTSCIHEHACFSELTV
jgi:hypothetical protein